MSDALRRAVRSFVQSFVGVLIASGVLSAASENGVVDWSAAKKAAMSAVAAGFVAVLTYVQNALEDNTSMPAVLKAPASEGENPVPGPEAGDISPVTLVLIAILVVVVFIWLGWAPE
jgi:hypothetical protein